MEFGDWKESHNIFPYSYKLSKKLFRGRLYNLKDVQKLLMVFKTTPLTS